MTDYPDWQNPIAIADEIALTGVGLLRNEQAVASGSVGPLGAGASSSIGPFPMNSTSYELVLTLTASALTAICNGEISIKWSNSGGGTQLAQKTFSAVASTGGHKLTITGPVRGSSLTITFRNSSISLANVTFGYTVVASSRLAANDLFRTITGVGTSPPTAETWSGLAMDAGVLGNAQPNVGAGATATRGLAAYNGPAQVAVVTNSGANDCEVIVGAIDTDLVVNTGVIFRDFTNNKGRLSIPFGMPMLQCIIQLTNFNAGAQVISFVLMTAEPNVN